MFYCLYKNHRLKVCVYGKVSLVSMPHCVRGDMFLFRWIWKNLEGYRRKYILALIVVAFTQIALIFNPVIMRTIVDTFIASEDAAHNIAEKQDLLITLIVLTVVVNLIRTAAWYGADMVFEHCSQGAVYRLRKHLFANMQSQEADFYDAFRTGDIMTRLSGDIEMVRHTIAWAFKTLFQNIICFLTVSIFYFTIHPLMALCMIGLTPVVLLLVLMFQKKAGPLYGQLRERLSDLNTAAEENISGNRTVKAFTAENYEIKRFRRYNKKYAEQSKDTTIMWWKFFLPMETVSQSIFAVHLLAGGLFAVAGQISMGDYMAFSALAWAVSMPMSMLGYVIGDLKRFAASANKVVEIYYSRSKIVDRSDAVRLTGRIRGDLEFRNVTFAYSNGAQSGKNSKNRKSGSKVEPVLNNISFKVAAGETVGIMGETGSGKTTLVNLIPRIYDVARGNGEILVDGHNIRMLKLKDLRSAIGIATQDVLLYSDTIEGNIAFGVPDMEFEDVVKCAEMADAHGFITQKTSDGYDTIVGERGVGLSGGQKQRIALARALAVKPSILILDDTTSAVDSETEKHIQKSLREVGSPGRPCTKIIIATRISSVKDADKIIILQGGKITEMGTHDELVKLGGYYKELLELQS